MKNKMEEIRFVKSPKFKSKKIKVTSIMQIISDYDEDEDYAYDIRIRLLGPKKKKDIKARILINQCGVSVEYKNRDFFLCTNIMPITLFPAALELSWQQLHKIVKVLDDTDFEGRMYENMDSFIDWMEMINETEEYYD